MDSTERLLDLVAFLLASRRPVTPADIYDSFQDEYAGSFEARDRKLSRDKEKLRALGVPVVHVPPGEAGDDGGLTIDRGAFYLPDVAFSPDERAALFAVGAAALRSALPLRGELAHALAKLRATGVDGEERAQPVISAGRDRASAFEELIVRGTSERRRLRLTYPPEQSQRIVEPYAFSARRNRFVFVGYCHLRQAIRTFYADRITTCELAIADGRKAEFEVPSGFDPRPQLPVHPWQVRLHAPLEVELSFSPELAVSGPQALGLEPGLPCVTTNLDGLIAQVLALGQGVVIVGPAKARERLRAKLRGLRDALRSVA